jgi:hypothetical protein
MPNPVVTATVNPQLNAAEPEIEIRTGRHEKHVQWN